MMFNKEDIVAVKKETELAKKNNPFNIFIDKMDNNFSKTSVYDSFSFLNLAELFSSYAFVSEPKKDKILVDIDKNVELLSKFEEAQEFCKNVLETLEAEKTKHNSAKESKLKS